MTDILKQLETIEQITIAIQRLKGVSSALFLAYDLSRDGCPYTKEDLIREHIEEIHNELLRLQILKREASSKIKFHIGWLNNGKNLPEVHYVSEVTTDELIAKATT